MIEKNYEATSNGRSVVRSLPQTITLMKKMVWLILLLGFFTVTAQQTDTRSLSSFKAVKASEAIDVYLKKGDRESARVEATGVSTSDVVTEISGSTLRVHMRDGNYRKSKSVKVYVTYVALERLSSSSAANIFSEGTIKADEMEINCSSAGSVEISIEANRVSVDVSSAADVTLEGKARSLTVEVSSAGSVDAYSFESEIVEASASSAGSAKVSASKEIEAHASSGGSIRYRGNPERTNTNASSGGSVKKSS